VDLLPTLAAAAGAPLPSGQILDGENLLPVLRDPSARLTRTAIFQHFPGYLGAGAGSWRTTPVSLIHEGDWKLMEFLEDDRLELYHLRDDIGERVNLAAAQPERARALHARLVAWRRDINAPMPTANRPAAAPPAEKAGKAGKAGKRKAKSDGN
jgi:arylsulfatase A-like enzyme